MRTARTLLAVLLIASCTRCALLIPNRPMKEPRGTCTPVTLYMIGREGVVEVQSDELPVWPPICAEDEEEDEAVKQQPAATGPERRVRIGSFVDDFGSGMSRERRALNSDAFEFFRTGSEEPMDAAMGVILAQVANEALRVGKGVVPMKQLAATLERFGVRRKA